MNPYEGFEDFVASNTRALSRTAFLLVGDHHLAEALLQSALGRVAARWPQVRDGAPVAYTRKVMVNEMLSWRRRRSYHERAASDIGEKASPEDLATAVVRRVVVGRALSRLT